MFAGPRIQLQFSLRATLQASLRLLQRGLHTMLPCSCALCGGTAPDTLCTACRRQFFSQTVCRCQQCALPLPDLPLVDAPRCGNCLQQAPYFDASIAASDYIAPIDELVIGLKFGGQLALAPLMASLLRDAMLRQTECDLPDLLIPVPLANDRLRTRGFNQAIEIGRSLSASLGVPLAINVVMRHRETAPQSLLPLDARHANLRAAFSLTDAARAAVQGRHIGVVDDVMTTGATLQAMAAILKEAGAQRVTNLIFARTLPK